MFSGVKKDHITRYTLGTCVWARKTGQSAQKAQVKSSHHRERGPNNAGTNPGGAHVSHKDFKFHSIQIVGGGTAMYFSQPLAQHLPKLPSEDILQMTGLRRNHQHYNALMALLLIPSGCHWFRGFLEPCIWVRLKGAT